MIQVSKNGLAVFRSPSRPSERHSDGGSPPVLLLVHGTLDRAASMIRLQRHLDDFEVVRYDRRGYGRSVGLDPTGGLEANASDLVDIVEQYCAGRQVVVFGHSFGGLVALAAVAAMNATSTSVTSTGASPAVAGTAVTSGRISGLVLYEPPMGWAEWWPHRSKLDDSIDKGDLAEAFMRTMIGSEAWQRLPQRVQSNRRKEGPAVFSEAVSVRRGECPIRFENIGIPCLSVCGGNSAGHQQRAAHEIALVLDLCRLETIDGASHNGHLSHPEEVAHLIREFAQIGTSRVGP